MVTFYWEGRTHLYQVLFHKIVTVASAQDSGPIAIRIVYVASAVVIDEVLIVIFVVLEKFEAAVDHRWVGVCLKCGTRQFEKDDECVRLVIVQLWVGDK